MSENSNWLLKVENLRKDFPLRTGRFGTGTQTVKAVDGVSFYIEKGETLGLVGESGSGKTTIGRSILRAFEPTSGSVRFQLQEGDITDVLALNNKELKRFRQHIQMIFQDPYSSLNPRKSIGDIIMLPLRVQSDPNPETWRKRTEEIMDLVGLPKRIFNNFPSQLSGGQRQRVAIARALINRPKIVICDEPTSALDVSVQSQILNLLQDLRAEFGLTYVIISHNLAVVEHMATRVAVMYLGRIVELAPTEELFAEPNHPYTQALLREVPRLDTRRRRFEPVKGEIPSPLDPPPGCHFHPRCPFAMDRCRDEEPLLKEVAPGRVSACHLNDAV